MIISFCGRANFSENEEIKTKLLELLKNLQNGNPITFYLGGYGNFDLFAKNCAKEHQKAFPSSKVVFVSPYLGKWLEARRSYLENTYDEIIFPEIENTPPRFAIIARNKWMISNSDLVIAYVNTHYGGAYTSLLYAYKNKKPIINLYDGDYDLL